MRFHFAAIPVLDSAAAERDLNAFLAAHRVVTVDRQLIASGLQSTWAVCVAYSAAPAPAAPSDSGGRERIDYKQVLAPAEFAQFTKLRELRKQLAERDGVPAYAIVTNEQLAAIVRQPVTSLAELAAIDGVGPARVDKYGRAILSALGVAAES